MYTIPELRLNSFELCSIPSPKELYQRIGFRSPHSSAGTVGEDGEFVEPINKVASNLDAIRIGERYADMARFDALRAQELAKNEPEGVQSNVTISGTAKNEPEGVQSNVTTPGSELAD